MDQAALYQNYTSFKGWSAQDGGERADEFAALFKLGGVPAGAAVLDFGAGNGFLLDWAMHAGFSTTACERIPEACAALADRGHRIVEVGDPASADFVTAIDVFEHLTAEEVASVLVWLRQVTRPGGRLVARFPNGASPFSGRFQYGDLTHRQVLSADSFRQIAEPSGWTVIGSHNLRPMPRGFAARARRRAVYAVRDVLEITVGYAYHGLRFPMDPNVVVVAEAR